VDSRLRLKKPFYLSQRRLQIAKGFSKSPQVFSNRQTNSQLQKTIFKLKKRFSNCYRFFQTDRSNIDLKKPLSV